jgi:hypothetical protein
MCCGCAETAMVDDAGKGEFIEKEHIAVHLCLVLPSLLQQRGNKGTQLSSRSGRYVQPGFEEDLFRAIYLRQIQVEDYISRPPLDTG